MLDRLDDTIVAVSSAPGYGAVGIVRLSGPQAVMVVGRMSVCVVGETLRARRGSTRISGELSVDADVRLPAVFYLFRGPHSYTRQDLVEIYTLGSPVVLERVRRRAVALGAVAAEPGEFTARAFLNGGMNLAAAEAVAGIIRAQSDTQLRASRRMKDGLLTERIGEARDELAELLALVEAGIDFAEEPIEFITPPVLRERLSGVTAKLSELATGARSVERLHSLPHILLLGPPNAGKSSLMNRLSGTSRAICAAAAGTTRDILSAPMRIGAGEAILLDSAGVDASDDEVLAQARAMTLSTAERVDLVCVVVDLNDPPHDMFISRTRALELPRVVMAANKRDLLSTSQVDERVRVLQSLRLGPVYAVSALCDVGLEALRDALCDAVGASESTTLGEAVLLTDRQRSAMSDALQALQRAAALAETADERIDCADLLAFELREALDALGSVTGEITTEDLLGRVFARFCIGK